MADPVSITTATLEFLNVVIKVAKKVKEMREAGKSMATLELSARSVHDDLKELEETFDPKDENFNDPYTARFRRFYETSSECQGSSEKRKYVPGPLLRKLHEILDEVVDKLRPLDEDSPDPAVENSEKNFRQPCSLRSLRSSVKQGWTRFQSKKLVRQFEWPFVQNEIEKKVKLLKDLQHEIRDTKINALVDIEQYKRKASEYHEIINWLNPVNFEDAQLHHSDNFLVPTLPSDWLIQDPVFEAWEEGRSWHLALYGLPGSGKTVLSSQIVSHLRDICKADPKRAVIFIYLKHEEQQIQTLGHVISLLLKQLVVRARPANLSSRVREKWQEAQSREQSRPESEPALKLLEAELRSLDRTYVILDGLDEASKDTRMSLLEHFRKLLDDNDKHSQGGQVSFLFTSRRLEKQEKAAPDFCGGFSSGVPCRRKYTQMYYAGIYHRGGGNGAFLCSECASSKNTCLSLERHFDSIDLDLRTPKRSIARYVRSLLGKEMASGLPVAFHVTGDTTKLGKSDSESDSDSDSDSDLDSDSDAETAEMTSPFSRKLKRQKRLGRIIVDSIVETSENLYMLAQMQWNYVRGFSSEKEIIKALSSVPKELEDSYRITMERLTKPPVLSKDAEQARLIVMWVSQCKGTLTLNGLREVMSIDPEEFGKLEAHEMISFHKDGQKDKLELMAITKGLVTMWPDRSLHLSHRTAYEYFSRKNVSQEWFPNAPEYMTRSCLVALSYKDLEVPCQGSENSRKGLTETDLVQKRARKFPFAAHASQYWGVYAKSCQSVPTVADALKVFLSHGGNVASAVQLGAYQEEVCQVGGLAARKGINALHLSAWFGLDTLLEYYLRQDSSRADEFDNTNAMLTPLMYACRGGHPKAVQTLMAFGAHPNYRNAKNSTSLIQAAATVDLEKHNAAVGILCGYEEVDVNATMPDGHTALIVAASRGYTPIVAELLKDPRIDPDRQADRYRYTALALAARKGYTEVVELLLSDGRADVNLATSQKLTPLHQAAKYGHDTIVAMLIKNGANLDVQDIDGRNPLRHAVDHGHIAVIERFPVQFFVDNVMDNEGKGLLFGACSHGDIGVVQLLIDHKFDVNQTSKKGRTVLHDAACSGNVEVITMLLRNGADPSIKDVDGNTAADLARNERGDFNLASRLSSLQPQHAAVLDEGSLPAVALAYKGSSRLLEERVARHDNDIFVSNSKGETPLAIAIRQRHIECARIIFRAYTERKESIDNISEYDRTPLHEAVDSNDIGILKLLLSHNPTPNLNVRERTGATPLALAIRMKNAESVVELLKAGAEIDSAELLPEHTLEVAIESGQTEIVLKLVRAGFPIRNQHLSLAKEKGQTDIWKLLKRNWTLVQSDSGLDKAKGAKQSELPSVIAESEISKVSSPVDATLPDFSKLRTKKAQFKRRETASAS